MGGGDSLSLDGIGLLRRTKKQTPGVHAYSPSGDRFPYDVLTKGVRLATAIPRLTFSRCDAEQ